MRPAHAFILVLLLLTAPVAFGQGIETRVDSDLVADAGVSQVVYNNGTLQLSGRASGGAAPYSYSWSWQGDGSRFSKPAQANTSFSAAGIPAGDILLTLAVTDSTGAVATDTVRQRVVVTPVLFQLSVPVQGGVPDEIAGSSAERKAYTFAVPAGTARIVASLDWDTSPPVGYDLDLSLRTVEGASLSGAQGRQGSRPERVDVAAPQTERLRVDIEPVLSGPTTARLAVYAYPAVSLPSVQTGGPYRFGRLDDQLLQATASGGVAPYNFTWDLDGDGIHEATGANVTSFLGVGKHAVTVRVTDAAGYEATRGTTVEVVPSERILRFRCGGDVTTTYWAMEYESSHGTCWIHGGHHTYFTRESVFAVRRVVGVAFAVEQQFSPPTEYNEDDPTTTPMHLQTSLDGQDWTELGVGRYQFGPGILRGSLAMPQRQYVGFDLDGGDRAFRFLRVHAPLSAAQGLSGYLDHTHLDVEADLVAVVTPGPLAEGARSFDCETGDLLEDFFESHPCWFGGIDRYDAASFYHTYYLGEGAQPTRVSGEFTLMPWRTDDFFTGDRPERSPYLNATVLTSLDGVHWTEALTLEVTYGESASFDVDLDGSPARFVRLFPERHPWFDWPCCARAPSHHANGFFTDSRITVEGLLPEA